MTWGPKGRRRATAAIIVGGLTLGALATDARSAATPSVPCNPLSTAACFAPLPSDYWTVKDATSATGLRLVAPDAALPAHLFAQLPVEDGIIPSKIFENATGFSAGAGVAFEFEAPFATPPADGGQVIAAYDLTTKTRLAIDTFRSMHARNPLIVKKPSHVLQVFARTRWPHGHRVLVTVAGSLGGGGSMLMDKVQTAAPGTRGAEYVADVLAAMRSVGADPATTRTATVFTVRDRADAISGTERLIADTSVRPHPVRDVRMHLGPVLPFTAGIVTGQVRLDNYRMRGGHGPVDFSGATRKDQWVPFHLTLPNTAGARPAPVVIYTHGITISKETDVIVSMTNAKLGLATMSIDFPNHGVRSRADGGNILALVSPRKLGTFSGLFNQATIDLAGLYDAIGEMRVDLLRRSTLTNPFGRGGDGRNDINPASISMQGTSLGGVVGGNFAALAPKLDAISFHVHGHSLARAISQTSLWNALGRSVPHGRSGIEDAVFQVAIQQTVDPSDGINTVDFIRYPRPGQTRKPMQMLIGNNDAIVPLATSTAVANILDIPLVGNQIVAMPGVRRAAAPDPDGYELRQFHRLFGAGPLSGESAHVSFIRPEAAAAQASFMRRHVPRP